MPFELFPASRCTERGKRKPVHDADHPDSASAAGIQKDSAAETTTDDEVEEFFAILKRLHAATKYIEKIDGASSLLMGKRSKRMKEDEIRAERITEHKLDGNLDLDLNLEPASVESDGKEIRRIGRSHNLKPFSVDSAADSRRK